MIRSVDCSASNHTPITMQAGNPLARRTDDGKDGGGYPSMGSVAAKFRGPNAPAMPAFVGLADSWKADVSGPGHMGAAFEPVKGNELAGRLALPDGRRRRHAPGPRRAAPAVRPARSATSTPAHQMAAPTATPTWRSTWSSRRKVRRGVRPVARARQDCATPTAAISVGEKALLARRLVEAGTTFVLVSGRGATSTTTATTSAVGRHPEGADADPADHRPGPDHARSRTWTRAGCSESTLVLMIGEFGRSPVMTKDAGRDHWTPVMSMLAAGGVGQPGSVVGSTEVAGRRR